MNRIALYILAGMTLGGLVGFWWNWLIELRPHVHGPLPDIYWDIISAIIAGVIGAFIGLIVAAVMESVHGFKKKNAPISPSDQNAVWPPPPAA